MKIIGQVPPVLLYLLISLSTLTETIYSSALPQIAKQLNTDGGIAQLSTAAYHFGFAIGIFTLGRISDIYGRRPVVLFGIGFYVIVTFLISLSPDINTFIVCRFLQAYGASVGSVIAQAMTRDSYKGWELSYIYASVAMVMSVVPTIGSTIGGCLILYFEEWQYIFYFLVTLASAMLILYIIYLPETNPNVGLSDDNRYFRLLKVLLKDKIFLSNAFIIGVYNGITFGFYIQAPFIFIDRLKMLPSIYGQLFLLLGISSLFGGLMSTYMIKRFVNTEKIRIIGFTLSTIGCTILLIGSYFLSIWEDKVIYSILFIFIPMSIHILGNSMVAPMILRHALDDYTKVVGTAGSVFGGIYYIITALVSLLISTFHSYTINNFAYLFAILLTIAIGLFFCVVKNKQSN